MTIRYHHLLHAQTSNISQKEAIDNIPIDNYNHFESIKSVIARAKVKAFEGGIYGATAGISFVY